MGMILQGETTRVSTPPTIVDTDPSPNSSTHPVEAEPYPTPVSPSRSFSPPEEPQIPPSSPSGPTIDVHPEGFARLSFFPSDPTSRVPVDMFQVFNLPADRDHYPTDRTGLWAQTGMHLGRALGGVSRLLQEQRTYEDQSDALEDLQEELGELKKDHTRLHKENHLLKLGQGQLHSEQDQLRADHACLQEKLFELEVNQDVGKVILGDLQGELAGARKECHDLRALAADMAEERTLFLEERAERTEKAEALREENAKLAAEMEEKDRIIKANVQLNQPLKEENIKLKEEIQRLKEENSKLKAEAEDSVTKARPLIIAEYRRSAELKEEVIEQFGKGYAFAKSLITKAGVNPITVGLSSDEDASDGE